MDQLDLVYLLKARQISLAMVSPMPTKEYRHITCECGYNIENC